MSSGSSKNKNDLFKLTQALQNAIKEAQYYKKKDQQSQELRMKILDEIGFLQQQNNRLRQENQAFSSANQYQQQGQTHQSQKMLQLLSKVKNYSGKVADVIKELLRQIKIAKNGYQQSNLSSLQRVFAKASMGVIKYQQDFLKEAVEKQNFRLEIQKLRKQNTYLYQMTEKLQSNVSESETLTKKIYVECKKLRLENEGLRSQRSEGGSRSKQKKKSSHTEKGEGFPTDQHDYGRQKRASIDKKYEGYSRQLVESLEKKIQELQEQNRSIKNKNGKQNNQFFSFRRISESSDNKNQMARLTNAMGKNQQKCDIQNLNLQIKQLRQQNEDLLIQIQKLKEQNVEKHRIAQSIFPPETIASLQNQIAIKNKEVEELNQLLASSEAEKDKIITVYQEQSHELKDKMLRQQDAIIALKGRNEDLGKANKHLTREVLEKQRQKETLEEKVSDMEEQIKQSRAYREKARKIDDKNSKNIEELRKKEQQIQLLHQKIDSVLEINRKLTQQLQMLQQNRSLQIEAFREQSLQNESKYSDAMVKLELLEQANRQKQKMIGTLERKGQQINKRLNEIVDTWGVEDDFILLASIQEKIKKQSQMISDLAHREKSISENRIKINSSSQKVTQKIEKIVLIRCVNYILHKIQNIFNLSHKESHQRQDSGYDKNKNDKLQPGFVMPQFEFTQKVENVLAQLANFYDKILEQKQKMKDIQNAWWRKEQAMEKNRQKLQQQIRQYEIENQELREVIEMREQDIQILQLRKKYPQGGENDEENEQSVISDKNQQFDNNKMISAVELIKPPESSALFYSESQFLNYENSNVQKQMSNDPSEIKQAKKKEGMAGLGFGQRSYEQNIQLLESETNQNFEYQLTSLNQTKGIQSKLLSENSYINKNIVIEQKQKQRKLVLENEIKQNLIKELRQQIAELINQVDHQKNQILFFKGKLSQEGEQRERERQQREKDKIKTQEQILLLKNQLLILQNQQRRCAKTNLEENIKNSHRIVIESISDQIQSQLSENCEQQVQNDISPDESQLQEEPKSQVNQIIEIEKQEEEEKEEYEYEQSQIQDQQLLQEQQERQQAEEQTQNIEEKYHEELGQKIIELEQQLIKLQDCYQKEQEKNQIIQKQLLNWIDKNKKEKKEVEQRLSNVLLFINQKFRRQFLTLRNQTTADLLSYQQSYQCYYRQFLSHCQVRQKKSKTLQCYFQQSCSFSIQNYNIIEVSDACVATEIKILRDVCIETEKSVRDASVETERIFPISDACVETEQVFMEVSDACVDTEEMIVEEIQEKEELVEKLKDEVAQLKNELTLKNDITNRLTGENSSLVNELYKKKEINNALEDKIAYQQQNKGEQAQNLKIIYSHLGKLIQFLSNQFQHKIKLLQGKVILLSSSVQKLYKFCSTLFNKQDKQVQILLQEIKQMQELIERMQQEHEEKRELLRQKQLTVSQLQYALSATASHLTTLSDKITRKQKQVDIKNSEIEQLNRIVYEKSMVEKSYQNEQCNLTKLNLEREELKTKVKQLEGEKACKQEEDKQRDRELQSLKFSFRQIEQTNRLMQINLRLLKEEKLEIQDKSTKYEQLIIELKELIANKDEHIQNLNKKKISGRRVISQEFGLSIINEYQKDLSLQKTIAVDKQKNLFLSAPNNRRIEQKKEENIENAHRQKNLSQQISEVEGEKNHQQKANKSQYLEQETQKHLQGIRVKFDKDGEKKTRKQFLQQDFRLRQTNKNTSLQSRFKDENLDSQKVEVDINYISRKQENLGKQLQIVEQYKKVLQLQNRNLKKQMARKEERCIKLKQLQKQVSQMKRITQKLRIDVTLKDKLLVKYEKQLKAKSEQAIKLKRNLQNLTEELDLQKKRNKNFEDLYEKYTMHKKPSLSVQ